jgi:hypothetical protein
MGSICCKPAPSEQRKLTNFDITASKEDKKENNSSILQPPNMNPVESMGDV